MVLGIVSSVFVGAADFSKKSDKEFIALAGSISPSDEPDYMIELRKRLDTKLYPEAKNFKKAIQDAKKEAHSKLSEEQRQKRAIQVCKAMRSKTDTMSGKEIRESGLRIHYEDCDTIPKKPKH